ncbi:MAG: CYTH domain-containing protein [Lachnospiraceae bacterium]|nr:CYTH domain-containing protein [Lachnospiraceae bacterium]
MEIESKYLISDDLPFDPGALEKKEIEQAYVNRDPTIRVRKQDDRFILTVKFKVASGGSEVLCNEEHETEIDARTYESLKAKRDGNLISKTRCIVPLEPYECGGRSINVYAELDIFHGALEGLRFAEVEFPTIEAANAFVPPSWMIKNVSGDKRYKNGYLSAAKDVSDIIQSCKVSAT